MVLVLELVLVLVLELVLVMELVLELVMELVLEVYIYMSHTHRWNYCRDIYYWLNLYHR